MLVERFPAVCHLTSHPEAFTQPFTTLLPARHKHSFEGISLSVTHCTEEALDAWARIAELSDTAVVLQHIDGSPGVFALQTRQLWNAARRWGVERGLLVPRRAWTWSYYDDELEDEVVETFNTRKEAIDAAGDFYEDVKRHIAYDPGPTLLARFRQYGTEAPAITEAANLMVAERFPELDGIWWDVSYTAWEAPAGGILPHALPRWHSVELFSGDDFES